MTVTGPIDECLVTAQPRPLSSNRTDEPVPRPACPRYRRTRRARARRRVAERARYSRGSPSSRRAIRAHGDVATNAAMVLAKPAGMKPRDLAEGAGRTDYRRRGDLVTEAADVPDPGFINLRIADAILARRALAGGAARSAPTTESSDLGAGREGQRRIRFGQPDRAAPPSVMHAGAVFGDALRRAAWRTGRLRGHPRVLRQRRRRPGRYALGRLGSTCATARRSARTSSTMPRSRAYYPGEYLKGIGGGVLAARDGGQVGSTRSPDEWLGPLVRDFAIDALMAIIKEDLAALGIRIRTSSFRSAAWSPPAVSTRWSRRSRRGASSIRVCSSRRRARRRMTGNRAPSFSSGPPAFGDDVDRPLKKSDGSWTYFAGDLAYHLDK